MTAPQKKRGGGRPVTHGMRALARRVRENRLDGRTKLAKMLKVKRDEIAADAGGWSQMTARERVLVDRAAFLSLMLESVEHWILQQPGPVTKSGELLPVLKHGYSTHYGSLTRTLVALGLRPNTDRIVSLNSYIESRDDTARPSEVSVVDATATTGVEEEKVQDEDEDEDGR